MVAAVKAILSADKEGGEEMTPVYVPNTNYRFGSVDNGLCLYNDCVMCDEKGGCKRCGWNPVVAMRRVEKVREELLREKG